jgi:hypothetical protein
MTIETCADLGGYFRSLLRAAMQRQHVNASPETADYVAGVMVTYAARPAAEFLDRPIVIILEEALAKPEPVRGAALQQVGDGALYLSGLFGDHVERAQGTTSFHVRLGGFAYREAAALARIEAGTEPVALTELAERFPRFVDVLADVAESQALGSVTRSIVQLYDRWKNADSERAIQEMARRGAFPTKGGVS